jgi:hypothetical protein
VEDDEECVKPKVQQDKRVALTYPQVSLEVAYVELQPRIPALIEPCQLVLHLAEFVPCVFGKILGIANLVEDVTDTPI